MKPEFNRWELAGVWLAFAVVTLTSVVSFRRGDNGWGATFALFALLFAVVLSGGHAVRRQNRGQR